MSRADEHDLVEDHAVGGIRRLNESFYQSNPGVHLDRRVHLIAAFADTPAAAPAGPFTEEVLSVMPGWQLSDQTHAEDERAKDDAVLLESFMLAYQAAEVMLRHFFAHVDAADLGCPWWELADLGRRNQDFKRRVEESAVGRSPEFITAVDDHLLGGLLDQVKEEFGSDHVSAVRESFREWISYLAKHVTEHRDSYNAAKHGLASVPSSFALSIGDESPDGVTEPLRTYVSGPSLEVLKYRPSGDGKALNWFHTREVMDAVVLLRVASVAAGLLQQLFIVGKARHLGIGSTIPVQPYPKVQEVIRMRPHLRKGAWSVQVGQSS